jgi:hypothetical protein
MTAQKPFRRYWAITPDGLGLVIKEDHADPHPDALVQVDNGTRWHYLARIRPATFKEFCWRDDGFAGTNYTLFFAVCCILRGAPCLRPVLRRTVPRTLGTHHVHPCRACHHRDMGTWNVDELQTVLGMKREPHVTDVELGVIASRAVTDWELMTMVRDEYEAKVAKDAELIQRLVDTLQHVADAGTWSPDISEAIAAADAHGFKPSEG